MRLSWLIYLVIAGVMLLPGLLIGPSLDAAVFSSVGWRIANGDLLYAQVWDHKPPAVFTPSLVAHAVTASPAMAWAVTWAMTVLCIVACAWIIQRALRARGLGWGAHVAAALAALVLASYLLTLGGGLGESFAILPATVAVALALRGHSNPVAWLLAGLAAGAAAIISLQAITVVAALAALGSFAPLRVVLARAAMVALGLATVAGMTLAGLIVAGTLPDAFDALVTYNGAYRSAVSAASTTASGGSVLLPWVFLSVLPLVVPAATALISFRRARANRDLLLANAAWIVATGIAVAIQGRLYGHYALPMVTPLALMAGLGLDGMAQRLGSGSRAAMMLLAPVAVATLLTLVVGAAGATMEQRWIRSSNVRVAAVGQVIRERSSQDNTIFVWGNEPRLYELSDRAPALRYLYLYPLLTRGYVTPGLVDELVAQLAADPPTMIVDAGSEEPGAPGLPPLLINRPVATDGRDYDILDPFRSFIADHYTERDTVAGWVLYTRADAP